MRNVSIDADRVLRRGRDDKEAKLTVQEQADRVDEEAARGEARAHELLAADRERQEESDVRTVAASRKPTSLYRSRVHWGRNMTTQEIFKYVKYGGYFRNGQRRCNRFFFEHRRAIVAAVFFGSSCCFLAPCGPACLRLSRIRRNAARVSSRIG
jgi:hypothetical protein